MQVQPVSSGDGVAKGVTGMSMKNHLGTPCGSRGEIEKTGIIATRFRSLEGHRSLIDDVRVARPGFASSLIGTRIDEEKGSQRGTLTTDLIHLLSPFKIGNDALRLSHLGAIPDVFGR